MNEGSSRLTALGLDVDSHVYQKEFLNLTYI